MKKALLFLVLLLPLLCTAQGEHGFYLQDIKVIPSDYDIVAKDFDNEKKDALHSIRVYIETKENELSEVDDKLTILRNDRAANMIDVAVAKQYLTAIDSMDERKLVDEKIKRYLEALGYAPQLYGNNVTIGDLHLLTEKIRKKVKDMNSDDEAIKLLRISKKNLVDDINKAQLRIDSLYGKLYDDGKFKIWITGIFSFIVGSLLLFFFIFISRKNETSMARDFLSSGNGLQFITLFSLIIAIILFGVLGVLEGRELAAILSGISGYILGKGITKPTDNAKQQTEKQPAETPEGNK